MTVDPEFLRLYEEQAKSVTKACSAFNSFGALSKEHQDAWREMMEARRRVEQAAPLLPSWDDVA